MTKDEALKLAQDACPYFDERLKGAFYEGVIRTLDQLPDATKMIDTGIDRGAWSDVPDATKWVDELRGDEEPPNSTTDVVESTDSLSTLLWRDLKTDRQRADWLRLGMGYQTGAVAAAIQHELAMAYERLVGFQKIHAALEQPSQDLIVGYADVHDLTRDGHDFWVSRQPGENTVPLYAAPPKREWVGLTDEEIGTAICNADYIYLRTCEDIQYVVFLAKVIEAKLKEKNT